MSKKVKQFERTSQRRNFYDRRVRKVGYSRVISISKIIPEDWGYVRMKPLSITPNAIEVLFEKLMGTDELAQSEGNHKEGEQNTQ